MEQIKTEHPNIIKYEDFTDQERELLIDVIRQYPVIWDASHVNRTKRNHLNDAYTEVAGEMNRLSEDAKSYPIDVIKRTWKCLRENFVYYIGKRRNTVKYANDNSNIKFRFFNRMAFMLKPTPNFASYEECISMLANSSANGSINNDEAPPPKFVDLSVLNNRKRAGTESPNYSDTSKKAKIEQHQLNESLPSNGYHSNSNPSICPAALSVDSTNNDLISASLPHIARQFRNEIATIVKKYEEILIDFEKQTYQ